MIKTFNCKETFKIWNEEFFKKFPANIQSRALTKLRIINVDSDLNDLKIPPSNYLEALKGNRKGQHSIRVNEKYRICFVWADNDAYEVEIVDYH